MIGSEKQIAWAEQIRQDMTKYEDARELFKAESSAKFWIENRQELASGLVLKFIRIS